ncbi:uncharacterized protein [Nicotiana tomentosiformis]|uniref:uncharacterized protein n=1 Tax=Nicotiana tomentosiformis TaxID=4098 RepID=UPI00388CB728
MEVIRKNFIAQTELRGGVKIAHFNARTVYIDLDNEYDHSTVWTKQYMYIRGHMMKLEALNPVFKPNKDSPIVPIWIVIPELPWHLYYMEILTHLLSPVGKAMFLDLASFQKIRGSVVKVKIQIDLTKERPSHVWLGYDENVYGDGQWLEIQYDNVPEYCIYCRHQGHSIHVCPVKKADDEVQRKKEEVAAASSDPQPSRSINDTYHVGAARQQQIKAPKGTPNIQGKDQNKNQNANESQNNEEHQSSGAAPSKDEWQTQKRKNFKGNSQTNKKQRQVYMPKQNAVQPNNASTQLNTATLQPVTQHHVPNPLNPHVGSSVVEVNGGNEVCQEKPTDRQEEVPKGVGIPHVLHECAFAQFTDHRLDPVAPATTDQTPVNHVTKHIVTDVNEEQYETINSEDDQTASHNDQLRSLLKEKEKLMQAEISIFKLLNPKTSPTKRKERLGGDKM